MERMIYELRYMNGEEGEFLGFFEDKADAEAEFGEYAERMHPENAADLVIRTLKVVPA